MNNETGTTITCNDSLYGIIGTAVPLIISIGYNIIQHLHNQGTITVPFLKRPSVAQPATRPDVVV